MVAFTLPYGIARVTSLPISKGFLEFLNSADFSSGGFTAYDYNMLQIEIDAINAFLQNLPTPVIEADADDRINTLLKLMFNCGISNYKGFISPVALDGFQVTPQERTQTIDNCFVDTLKPNETFVYNRRIKAKLLIVPDLAKRLRGAYEYIFRQLNGIAGRKIPFLNLDVRLVSESADEINKGNYKIVVTDVNCDMQDFLADLTAFFNSGLIGQTKLELVVDAILAGLSPGSEVAVIAPDNWTSKGF